jgi:hypothetical protein
MVCGPWPCSAPLAVWRRLNRVAVIMHVDDLAPVGGRAPGGRAGWRFERLAEMREGLISRGRSHPGLHPLANLQFEVSRLLPAVCPASVMNAMSRMSPPHPGHSSENSSPTRA